MSRLLPLLKRKKIIDFNSAKDLASRIAKKSKTIETERRRQLYHLFEYVVTDDLLVYIFKHVGMIDLVRLTMTCRRFYRIVGSLTTLASWTVYHFGDLIWTWIRQLLPVHSTLSLKYLTQLILCYRFWHHKRLVEQVLKSNATSAVRIKSEGYLFFPVTALDFAVDEGVYCWPDVRRMNETNVQDQLRQTPFPKLIDQLAIFSLKQKAIAVYPDPGTYIPILWITFI